MTDEKQDESQTQDSAAQESKATPKAKKGKDERDVLGPIGEDGVERFGTKVEV